MAKYYQEQFQNEQDAVSSQTYGHIQLLTEGATDDLQLESSVFIQDKGIGAQILSVN